MTALSKRAMVGIAVVMLLMSVFLTAPSEAGQTEKSDLYATGISGGKTKPLVDIENKVMRPVEERPIKKAEPTRRVSTSDTAKVEDAAKYQLRIEPIYPKRARVAQKEAVVEVNITFDKKGKMKDARIVKCTAPDWGFEQAVLAASLEARLAGHGEREVTVKATLKFELK